MFLKPVERFESFALSNIFVNKLLALLKVIMIRLAHLFLKRFFLSVVFIDYPLIFFHLRQHGLKMLVLILGLVFGNDRKLLKLIGIIVSIVVIMYSFCQTSLFRAADKEQSVKHIVIFRILQDLLCDISRLSLREAHYAR